METIENVQDINFETYVTQELLPQLKKFQMKRASVSSAFGDKATITKDKHGYYSVKFEYVKDLL